MILQSCEHAGQKSVGARWFKTDRRTIRYAVSVLILLSAVLQSGCELVPSRPDAIFILYRDRMKSGNVSEARKLLSEDSKILALDLISQFKLENPPENSALLNVLDPQGPPIVTMSEEKFSLLQVRTLKGGVRLIRVVRDNANSPWKIQIVEELKCFRTFLEAQTALEMMREKAGEYAASWRAFSDQLDRMTVTEEPQARTQTPKQAKNPRLRKSDKGRKTVTP